MLTNERVTEAANHYVGYAPIEGESITTRAKRLAFLAGVRWAAEEMREFLRNEIKLTNDGLPGSEKEPAAGVDSNGRE